MHWTLLNVNWGSSTSLSIWIVARRVNHSLWLVRRGLCSVNISAEWLLLGNWLSIWSIFMVLRPDAKSLLLHLFHLLPILLVLLEAPIADLLVRIPIIQIKVYLWGGLQSTTLIEIRLMSHICKVLQTLVRLGLHQLEVLVLPLT